jgi:squalene cyclase
MKGCGSQLWDTSFAIQALLASNLTDEIGPTLARGHDFFKKSQVLFSFLNSALHHNPQTYLFD